MGVVGRNALVLGRRRQTCTGLGGGVGVRQRESRHRSGIAGRDQRVAPKRYALRHSNLSAAFIGRECMVGRIARRTLVQMKKIRMIELHRARMGVDKWRHRLQDDKKPEQQGAGTGGRHSRIAFFGLGSNTRVRLQDTDRRHQPNQKPWIWRQLHCAGRSLSLP